ncbi:hypothetical protein QQ045_005279 [Rhodiola kirilowii]
MSSLQSAPYGYDSQTFKIGPFSCVICQALFFFFKSSRCVCLVLIACVELALKELKMTPIFKPRFIDGHARIKRSHAETNPNIAENDIYEDVSLERGAFLVQHAMRAFCAQNIESAKSRLSICSDDIREQFKEIGTTSELCSQLGAHVLGIAWRLLSGH